MERLAKLILSFVDLAEVEVQSLKRGTVRLCFTLLALIGGAILALVGISLVLAAAYIALEHAIGRVASLASVGGTFLIVGLVLLILSWRRGAAVLPVATPVSPAGTSPPEGVTDDPSMRIAS